MNNTKNKSRKNNIRVKQPQERNDLFCSNQIHFEMSYKNVTARVGRIEAIIPLCKKCYDLAFNVCSNCGEIHSGLSCAYISDAELKEKGYNPRELNFDWDLEQKKEPLSFKQFAFSIGAMFGLLIGLVILRSFL